MGKKFSKETLLSIFSCENTLVNTFKFTGSAMCLLLFIATIFSSCTMESLQNEPSKAKALMHSEDVKSSLAHVYAWWEGNATTADETAISCRAEQTYNCQDTVDVTMLGLPVILSGDPVATANGYIFNLTDNQQARLTVKIETNGIIIDVPVVFDYATLELIDAQHERVLLHFSVNWSMFTTLLPASSVASASGLTEIILSYIHRVPAATPAPAVEYRKRTEDAGKEAGNQYVHLFYEKSSDGGQSWEVVAQKRDFIACSYGQWNPSVLGSLAVTSFDFKSFDTYIEKPLDQDKVSPDGMWRTVHVLHREYKWDDQFPAPEDASHSTVRSISGTEILKVYKAILISPETGEEVVFDFTGLMTSTHSVDANGLYTREVSVILNDEVIETQPGTVQLELVK